MAHVGSVLGQGFCRYVEGQRFHAPSRARGMFKNDGVLQASYYHMTSNPERYVGGRSSNQTGRGRDECVASSLFLLIPGLKYSVP